MNTQTRIERDFLGEKEIPESCYYGIQTLRAMDNFQITGIAISSTPEMVNALAYVKKAACLANRDLGVLEKEVTRAIVSAPLTNAQYCYAVQKGDTEILELFGSGLAILVNTGSQQELHAKWLGGQDDGPARLAQLLRLGTWVLSPLLLVIVGVVIWNTALKRKVAERTRELEERQQQLIQADKLASLGIIREHGGDLRFESESGRRTKP